MGIPEELKDEPEHLYCELTNLVSSNGIFYFLLRSGGKHTVFTFTPDHAKQVMKLFVREIEKYESQNGVLLGRLPSEPMVSPMQIDRSDDKNIEGTKEI